MKNDPKRSTNTTQTVPLETGSETVRSEEDELRTRAYELFLERDCEPGHVDDDWFRAESEIRKDRKTSFLEDAVDIPRPEGSR